MASIMQEITLLFNKYGNERYLISEEITQKNHALQSAWIAKMCHAPEEVIIALLLHDIGQLTHKELAGNTSFLHARHDELGGLWLFCHDFPDSVIDFAKYHTIAKIELCELDSTYFESLSKASQESYLIQKQKYVNSSLYTSFKKHPLYEDFLAMRLCDDLAKSTDPALLSLIPSLQEYEEMLDRVLKRCSAQATHGWKQAIYLLSQTKRKMPSISLLEAVLEQSM